MGGGFLGGDGGGVSGTGEDGGDFARFEVVDDGERGVEVLGEGEDAGEGDDDGDDGHDEHDVGEESCLTGLADTCLLVLVRRPQSYAQQVHSLGKAKP